MTSCTTITRAAMARPYKDDLWPGLVQEGSHPRFFEHRERVRHLGCSDQYDAPIVNDPPGRAEKILELCRSSCAVRTL